MKLSYVAELATAGSKLNHRFKVKDLEGFEPAVSNSNLSNSVSNQKGFWETNYCVGIFKQNSFWTRLKICLKLTIFILEQSCMVHSVL